MLLLQLTVPLREGVGLHGLAGRQFGEVLVRGGEQIRRAAHRAQIDLQQSCGGVGPFADLLQIMRQRLPFSPNSDAGGVSQAAQRRARRPVRRSDRRRRWPASPSGPAGPRRPTANRPPGPLRALPACRGAGRPRRRGVPAGPSSSPAPRRPWRGRSPTSDRSRASRVLPGLLRRCPTATVSAGKVFSSANVPRSHSRPARNRSPFPSARSPSAPAPVAPAPVAAAPGRSPANSAAAACTTHRRQYARYASAVCPTFNVSSDRLNDSANDTTPPAPSRATARLTVAISPRNPKKLLFAAFNSRTDIAGSAAINSAI